MSRVIDSLPALYRTRLSPLLARDVPEETKATCSDCAMCDSARQLPTSDASNRLFRPDVKCCTYQPRLPNYLLGALLSDDSAAEGQRRVREKIGKRVGVSPQWLRPPAMYSLMYDQARNAFGRAEALRCPYFDTSNGGCTIWAYREAVCSTYFCRYEKGQDGHAMWMQVKAYLGLIELQLSRYAVFTLMPDYVLQKRDTADAPALTGADLDEQPAADYAAVWGAWAGREEAFYKRCYEVVAELDAAGVQRVLGIDGTLALAVLEDRQNKATDETLPDKLTFNPNATLRWLPGNVLALGAYSNLDALALDGSAYPLLVAFDGSKSTQEVRQMLRKEKQADVSDEVLMTLYRHRILTS